VNAPDDLSGVARAYDRWASTYDTDANRTRDLDAMIVQRHAPSVDGLDVVELGPGTGKNTVWLAERARYVIGLDASPGMLAVARKRISAEHVHFVLHDIQTPWPVPSASIDVVLGNLVLEHVERVGDVLAESARVVREAGKVFICELHPIRQFLGGRAHFTDVTTGDTVDVPVVQHSVSEFINGGLKAGLTLERVDEWWDDGDGGSDRRPPRLLSMVFSKRSLAFSDWRASGQ
jgi:ubiquinone/menaquinone biosynthesis C-methylase UbiE